LRQDGFLLESFNEEKRNMPNRFPDVYDKNVADYDHKGEGNIRNVGKVKQVAFDQGRRSIHLILSKKSDEECSSPSRVTEVKNEAFVLGRLKFGVSEMKNPWQLFAVRYQKFGERVIDISEACTEFIRNQP
jgi:hypothetical protein